MFEGFNILHEVDIQQKLLCDLPIGCVSGTIWQIAFIRWLVNHKEEELGVELVIWRYLADFLQTGNIAR